jgi:hypothetical protein
MLGREGTIGSSPVAGEHPHSREYQNPANSNSDDPPQEVTWGYPVDYTPDGFGSGADSAISDGDEAPPQTFYMDDRPIWGQAPEQARNRSNTSDHTPWGKSGGVMRAIRDGAARYRLYPRASDKDEYRG